MFCAHRHTCTSYACMCSYKVQLFSPCLYFAGSFRQKAFRHPAGLMASWEPHSWQGRDPICCVDGRSTKMGWSYPGLQSPPRFGIPAHLLPEPQSHTVPGPSALALPPGVARGPYVSGASGWHSSHCQCHNVHHLCPGCLHVGPGGNGGAADTAAVEEAVTPVGTEEVAAGAGGTAGHGEEGCLTASGSSKVGFLLLHFHLSEGLPGTSCLGCCSGDPDLL